MAWRVASSCSRATAVDPRRAASCHARGRPRRTAANSPRRLAPNKQLPQGLRSHGNVRSWHIQRRTFL
eukprot:3920451-Alexandrium_andersonii.AAC.1